MAAHGRTDNAAPSESVALKALKLTRAAGARLTTPLHPDDYLHLLNPLWSSRQLRGRIVRVIPETETAATLVIKPGWGWSFDYQPGQYVGIAINLNGRWHWRSYSLSSTPESNEGVITITVKAMPEGFLSSHLVNGLEPGTIVRLALPQGEFVLPDPPPPKILFWTGGSGITPVMSMLRTLARRDTMPDVVHVHAAPKQADVIFRTELLTLEATYPSLRFIENAHDIHGTLTIGRLMEVVPDWRERQAWVCGPSPMLNEAERHWKQAGLAKALHLERFSVTLSSSAGGGHVSFAVSGKEVDLDGATTLLEAGEAAGVAMPFGCRMGICHTCVVSLKAGRVKDLRNGTEFDAIQGVQTCITAAAGDCTLAI